MPQQQASKECGLAESEDGTKICGFHNQPLLKMAMYGDNAPGGLSQMSAWMCPVSKRPIFQRAE